MRGLESTTRDLSFDSLLRGTRNATYRWRLRFGVWTAISKPSNLDGADHNIIIFGQGSLRLCNLSCDRRYWYPLTDKEREELLKAIVWEGNFER